MTNGLQSEMGVIQSLWRYPVKSMRGEALSLAQVTDHGLVGDRAYAILDRADGKVATAKNPKKWPNMFAFQATFLEPSGDKESGSRIRITLPDGTMVTSEQQDLPQVLSKALNRKVTLALIEGGKVTGVQSPMPETWIAQSEEYWPDMDGREKRDTVTDFSLPTGTFFDAAMVHLLSTGTLNQLREAYPEGRFEVPRFRPNIVVDTGVDKQGFIEQGWIGQTLGIGENVRLKIAGSCGRCVMTTLAQGELPKDPGILRTAVQHNLGNVGVYASVMQGGAIRIGDGIRLEK
ncbi:MOSC domain-containing protein [Candidatus Nitrospira allomarina]|uniref:MOSC N-terminal beta barrel domain-containing protein n=1 Tax=Candidatus Nitrospira allomarina TaxID=3020900 RepID=A0AA96G8Y5_9BACT|nr:MOSC N-terminal beta barrel domain-containing protein [Candidatus Nitrospira allomarina]WNM57081.1 MOSC N-terminal beta barrel domain-containing protein [Candidatus Nitrospira allomarina]